MEKKIKLQIPLFPNFVYDNKGTQYDLRKDFSREELVELLKEWTDKIIERVKESPKK